MDTAAGDDDASRSDAELGRGHAARTVLESPFDADGSAALNRHLLDERVRHDHRACLDRAWEVREVDGELRRVRTPEVATTATVAALRVPPDGLERVSELRRALAEQRRRARPHVDRHFLDVNRSFHVFEARGERARRDVAKALVRPFVHDGLGARKQTPPVSTDEPPTHQLIVTFTAGADAERNRGATVAPQGSERLALTHRAVHVRRNVLPLFDDDHPLPRERELGGHDRASGAGADDYYVTVELEFAARETAPETTPSVMASSHDIHGPSRSRRPRRDAVVDEARDRLHREQRERERRTLEAFERFDAPLDGQVAELSEMADQQLVPRTTAARHVFQMRRARGARWPR